MVFFREITSDLVKSLSPLYKEVFGGYPYLEERICSGVTLSENERCSIQYTSLDIPQYSEYTIDYNKGEGVLGNAANIQKCIRCQRQLIDFYPNFVNQDDLIYGALQQDSFSGYVVIEEGNSIGFSFGYRIPEVRTQLVNFPLVRDLLLAKGIEPDQAFYGAGLGIRQAYRYRGLGLLASATRLYGVRKKGYLNFVLRTKNDRVLTISKKIFSGKEGRFLFQDPEKNIPWFGWNFKDLDVQGVSSLLHSMIVMD